MATEQERIAQLKRMTRRPSTPGEVAASIIEENDVTQTEMARRLGVSRVTINELLLSKRKLSPDMAHRLGRFFGNGPEIWLRMQAIVEMWDALHMDTEDYRKIEPLRVKELAA